MRRRYIIKILGGALAILILAGVGYVKTLDAEKTGMSGTYGMEKPWEQDAGYEEARIYFERAKRLGYTACELVKKEELYKKAIELCPSYAPAHNNLGDVYERQGRYEEAAIAKYKEAIGLMPTAPYPYFGLGDIYYKTNRPKEAIRWYKEGLRYDPNDTLTRKRLPLAEDIKEGGIIKAETIIGMLTTLRGPGEVVPITFGEGLIPFDFDKYHIRDDAKPQLNEIGKALRKMLGKDILVEGREVTVIEIAGHTDIRGTDEYNLRLSRARASSVVNYLINNFDIPEERLIPVGYGERCLLCTGTSEACHALNRRVEIIRKKTRVITQWGKTRAPLYTGRTFEPKLQMEVGFLYQRKGEHLVKVLKENTRLRSNSDKYLIFLRPLQDCYAYILQEDSKGNLALLFPKNGKDAYVRRGYDYWIPRFGKAYTLDYTKGEERLYLLVTSKPLETEIEGLSLKDQVRGAIRGLMTRAIKPVRPLDTESIPSEDIESLQAEDLESLLERIEGEGGWVKVVKFWHE